MSLGMYCAIPLPRLIWDDSCTNLMLPCLPLVGAIIGALWWGAAKILLLLGIHPMLTAAIVAMLPFFLTGFLHLDGYMDTSDAVLSRCPLEDKLRILKDPHTGAFAVIMVAALFLTQFAAVYALVDRAGQFKLLIAVAVLSRCCSSISILALPAMAQSGYANLYKANSGLRHQFFTLAVAAVTITLSILFSGIAGLVVAVAVILGFVGAMAYAYKEFGGVSGDLAGYALVVGELCGLVALAII